MHAVTARILKHCLLCGLLALASLIHCALAASEPIRIGEINPLTGKLATHGLEIHQGIRYAVEEINKRGGLGGRPVELFSRDDQSQPEVAINQAQELLLRVKVHGLVGGYVDSLVAPISELAAKHRVAYVASASLQRALTQAGKNPYFFRVARLDGIVQPICRFILQELQARSVAVIYAATPGSTEFGSDVREILASQHVAMPLFEKFRSGSPDFAALLLKLQRDKVDVVVSGGFYPDHLVLVRQLREQQVPIKAYFAPWGIAYQNFIDEMGESSEHILGTCAWNPGITLPGTEQESDAFVRGFRERFQEPPNTTTMHGYTSARAILAAMESVLQKKQALNGDTIRQELAQLDLRLPMEHLKFDQNGDPQHYQHVIVQIQQRKMVVVYPPDRATGKLIYPMK